MQINRKAARIAKWRNGKLFAGNILHCFAFLCALCGGQSNMEMDLNGCLGRDDDLKTADLPKIRRIKINHEKAAEPQVDVPNGSSQWQVCSPDTARGFTTVGFYFAREILAKTGIPIGIVDDNWGGTRIEPWTPGEGIAMVDELIAELAAQNEAIKLYQSTQMPKALADMEAWIALTKKQLASGTPTTQTPGIPANPAIEGWSGMYNAMIHPIVHFPIKGEICLLDEPGWLQFV